MDNGGLGVQTKEFYDHMNPDKTLAVDLSEQTGYMSFPERYPNAIFDKYPLDTKRIAEFLDGLDVVFTAESPYNYALFDMARERGITTIQQYNYEQIDYFQIEGLPL